MTGATEAQAAKVSEKRACCHSSKKHCQEAEVSGLRAYDINMYKIKKASTAASARYRAEEDDQDEMVRKFALAQFHSLKGFTKTQRPNVYPTVNGPVLRNGMRCSDHLRHLNKTSGYYRAGMGTGVTGS